MTQAVPTSVRKIRPDLQGMRTLAVGLVIIYHLFPSRLPGGFIGVDIFLVISGYLIIGSLTSGFSKTGRVDLLTFYARRIRRLLPASTVVLLSVMIATVVVLPQSRWQEVARDVVASALQIQNWNQALGATSYEAAGALASPVQHFWSLAVEEQFYLVIPLLLLLAVTCGRFLKMNAKAASLWFLVFLSAASLAHSIVLSIQNHDIAYFATTTRMWELALGGMAAIVLDAVRINYFVQLMSGWCGLTMIIAAGLLFDTSMAFPGYIALLPVVGTLMLIVSGAPTRSGPEIGGCRFSRLLSWRPVTYLGDISYSLYLWHWPVIVFYILIKGHEPGVVGGAGILALSLVLASLSYHFVEQRFRFGKPFAQAGGRRYRPKVGNRTAYGMAGSLILVSCVSAVAPWAVVQVKTLQFEVQSGSHEYPGLWHLMRIDQLMCRRVYQLSLIRLLP
ncbi:acyltransferase [Arthrobacter sp. lap29]|uniref:acyltransferase family protein n=1 Tax=Arthrobacter sp. lap29 TaxID=3056122 RepID=UPI0028F6D200|nr:acyltransferase [Arthrobacter sp. lap29]